MRWAIAALVLLWAQLSHAGRPEAARLAAEARHLESQGHIELAMERFHEALREDPDNLALIEELIPRWMKNEQFAAAARNLEIATLRHPRFAAGWYALAYAYRRLGRTGMAVLAYEAYIDLRPHNADPYYGIAMAHLEAGRYEDARSALTRYLRRERRPERARFVERARAELAELGGELEPERAPLEPGLVEAEALVRGGHFDAAERQLDGYRAFDVDNRGLALALRAETAAARGRSGPALWQAILAATLTPLSPAPWRALVRALAPAYL